MLIVECYWEGHLLDTIMVAVAEWVIHIAFLFLPSCCCECAYKENKAVEFWRVLVFQDKHGLPELPVPARGCSLIQEGYGINLFNMYDEAWGRLVQPPHFPHLWVRIQGRNTFKVWGFLSCKGTCRDIQNCVSQAYDPSSSVFCSVFKTIESSVFGVLFLFVFLFFCESTDLPSRMSASGSWQS